MVFGNEEVFMSKAKDPVVKRIKMSLGMAMLTVVAGCWGYVDEGYVGGGYGGSVFVPSPDVVFFGGGYERGRDVHEYSHRGEASRSFAHPARSTASRPSASSAARSGSGGSHGTRR